MPEPKKWMRLDNAAKIFPAVKRRDWSNVFRLSATLTQPIDPLLLQEAVRLVAPRFPSMLVSLHRAFSGITWSRFPNRLGCGRTAAVPWST